MPRDVRRPADENLSAEKPRDHEELGRNKNRFGEYSSADRLNHSVPSPCLLRFALGLVFFHFGFLKFFPDLSPAEMLASQTVMRLSGGSFDARTAMWWLALLECSIGVGFLLNAGLRLISFLFLLHMIGTFMPLFVLPELAFRIGLAPTLEGQYILKNIVFVAAGWTVLLPHCLPSGWKSVGQVASLGDIAETTVGDVKRPSPVVPSV